MLFGIDYARDLMQKMRDKEAQAYQDGYNAAAKQRQNPTAAAIVDDAAFGKGYDDGFNAGLARALASQAKDADGDYDNDHSS